jgi:hypothetical protein
LKVAHLLARFLYNNKRLALAGIGNFTLDENAVIQVDVKQQKVPVLEGIQFQNDTSVKEDIELIAFISAETGKMKALASADLDSYLALAKQFLNIGKPFLLEGIGTLVKSQTGIFEFSPGTVLVEKMNSSGSTSKDRDASSQQPAEESFTGYDNDYTKKSSGNPALKKMITALLIIAGLGGAVWGGYTIYKNSQSNEKEAPVTPISENNNVTPVKTDSSAVQLNKPDSTTQIQSPVTTAATGSYKFVIEETGKIRAATRFAFLKRIGTPIQLETKDSIVFKLFYVLPANPADTTRICDSLTRNYTPKGKRRTYIE